MKNSIGVRLSLCGVQLSLLGALGTTESRHPDEAAVIRYVLVLLAGEQILGSPYTLLPSYSSASHTHHSFPNADDGTRICLRHLEREC